MPARQRLLLVVRGRATPHHGENPDFCLLAGEIHSRAQVHSNLFAGLGFAFLHIDLARTVHTYTFGRSFLLVGDEMVVGLHPICQFPDSGGRFLAQGG